MDDNLQWLFSCNEMIGGTKKSLTFPEYRRRGYAQAVLKYWTMSVLQQGFLPLYSADVANTASLQLARKAQYILCASAFMLE